LPQLANRAAQGIGSGSGQRQEFNARHKHILAAREDVCDPKPLEAALAFEFHFEPSDSSDLQWRR